MAVALNIGDDMDDIGGENNELHASRVLLGNAAEAELASYQEQVPHDQDITALAGTQQDQRVLDLHTRSPEDITHRDVSLSMACVSGDLPLVAMLLAEGTEQGLDMFAGDSVSTCCRRSAGVRHVVYPFFTENSQ